MTINPVKTTSVGELGINDKSGISKKTGGITFSSYLNDALDKVNNYQIEADNYKKLLSTGDVDNLHDVSIAAEKANIAMQLTLSIRNKVVDAYREIMRMQI